MSWMNQIGGMLQQYLGANAAQAPSNAPQHFQQVAQSAPPDLLARGIASAFRSDQTPPFAQMVSQMFVQANPGQQAGLLNTLVGAVGPQVLSQALGGSSLAGLLGGGVSAQQASQMSPQAVQQLAAAAEQHNPSVVDTMGGFFAQHPGLLGGLGGGAVTAALAGMAQHHASGGVARSSQDPYGDPADQQVLDASQDPYGDPADQEDSRR